MIVIACTFHLSTLSRRKMTENAVITREDLRPGAMITLVDRSTGARVACGKVTSEIFLQGGFDLPCVGVMENFPAHYATRGPNASAHKAGDLSIWSLADMGVGDDAGSHRSKLVATVYQLGDEGSI
jgi:hypothetical protein